MANNKVKFNLWNVYYAPLLTNTTSKIEYGTPIAIPGAVSLSLDPTGENTPFYADGIEYYTISNNMGYSGDLEIALIPESFRVDILKESPDSNKVLIENKDINVGKFALLFRFDGDIRAINHVMYNCSVSRPKIGSKTNEESKEVQTETLTISAKPLVKGYVKAKTGDSTPQTVYDNWFKSVYLPVAAAQAVPATGTK
ncbi:MAG: phage tail protein [Clostridia bacterium]|nr:phage tail protein [Clostridia bacterium]MBQ1389944.1 phage tail protein [Clostridia bacterium]